MSDGSGAPVIEAAGLAAAGLPSHVGGWLRKYWSLFPLLALVVDFYWILWGNMVAAVVGIILIGIVAIDALVLKRSTLPTLKRYWPAIAILALISLSMYIRLFGFFTPDGGTRWPYLRNIDSYWFYRHMNSVVENGGTLPAQDTLMLAPYGTPLGLSLYYYIGAWAFMLVSGLSSIQLWQFLAWLPALFAALMVIPTYYIGKTLYDRKAGVLTALFMVFASPFMSRSLGGDPDSDAIVMLFAIGTIAAFLIMNKHLNRERMFAKKNVLLAGLVGLVLALFAYTWSGYWFAIWIIGSFIVLKVLLDFFLHRKHREDHVRLVWKHTKGLVVASLLALVVFWVLTVPHFGLGFAGDFAAAPMSAILGGGYKGEAGQFPNVEVSIAELQAGGGAKDVAVNAAGLDMAAGVSGLPLGVLMLVSPFLLTLICFVYLGYAYYKRREHLDTLLFMGSWFFGFMFASMIAVRFTIFLAPVYAICSGIILAKLWRVSTGEDRSLGA